MRLKTINDLLSLNLSTLHPQQQTAIYNDAMELLTPALATLPESACVALAKLCSDQGATSTKIERLVDLVVIYRLG